MHFQSRTCGTLYSQYVALKVDTLTNFGTMLITVTSLFVCFFLCFFLSFWGLGVFGVVVLSSFISHTCDNCLLHIRIDWLADSDTILHHRFYWRPFGRMIEKSFFQYHFMLVYVLQKCRHS